MKFFHLAVLLFPIALFAQKPCEFAINVTDSLGTYKETNDYLVHERNFAGKSSYAYLSFAIVDQMPVLKMQLIARSKDFIASNCLDKNSKIYLQLDNGKIVTLLHVDQLTCGTTIRNDQGFNNRILSGTFMFVKNSIEELRKSPVTLMRIKFTTETEDYIFPSTLKSELDGNVYDPQRYFINTLGCLDNQ